MSQKPRDFSLGDLGVLAVLSRSFVLLAGCDRSCVTSERAGQLGQALRTLGAVDCPDGLARCEAATVSVSRLATVPRSCAGPASACTCPWTAIGDCPGGCVADGVELVVEAPRAMAQLCAPPADAGPPAGPWPGGVVPALDCDEGDSFRCTGGAVIDCRKRTPVGQCLRGCYREGASLPDDRLSRETAFALLCSR